MKAQAALPILTKPAHARELAEPGRRLFALEARCTDLYDLCLPEVPAYGTESSVAYNTTGGGAGLVANFKNAFGDSFDPAICEADHVLEEGEIELAGIRFV